MKKILTSTLVASSLLLGTAAASFAEGSEQAADAAKQDQIRANLTGQGYDVRKVDMEDGMYEVYAMKDGKKVELYLNEALEIVKSKEAS